MLAKLNKGDIMKTYTLCITALFLVILGCASTSQSMDSQPSNQSQFTSSNSTGEQLDIAIRETSDYLNRTINAGNKLLIIDFQSEFSALSRYINDELTANAVNDRIFTIVDRQQLDAILRELNIGMSGLIHDDSAQRIGQMLGAQTIISGNISQLGNMFRLTVRALDVETARVDGQFNRNIPSGPMILALTENSPTNINRFSQPTETHQTQIATQTQLVDRTIPIPANLRAITESYTAIRLNWGHVQSAREYGLYVSSSENGVFHPLTRTNQLEYLHNQGLIPNTTRYYRISAVGNNDMESPLSNVVSGSTRQLPIPTSLTANTINSREIQLNWSPVQGATAYRIYGSSNSGTNQPLLSSTTINSYTHTGLSQMTTYYYVVSAVFNEHESGQSSVANATTPQAPITPPGDNILHQLNYIANQGGNGTVYEIMINENIRINPTTIISQGRNITVIIRSASPGDVKTIQLNSAGSLFSIEAGITVRLQDIILKGIERNNAPLVLVNSANLILDSGSHVTENGNGRNSNNAYGDGGGISVTNNGVLTMLGGIISKNHAYTNYGNPAAGGVYISSNSSFEKRGGIIYGSGSSNANTVNQRGAHAVLHHRSFGSERARGTTLGPNDDINTASNTGWGQLTRF